MELYLLKTIEGFYPAYAADSEAMSRLKTNEVYKVTVKKARNWKNHRRFFALLMVGFNSQQTFDSMEWYREWILMKAGHFETCKSPTGSDLYRAKSISFDNMDELEFQELYRDVSNAIIRLHKITAETVEENLNLFL